MPFERRFDRIDRPTVERAQHVEKGAVDLHSKRLSIDSVRPSNLVVRAMLEL